MFDQIKSFLSEKYIWNYSREVAQLQSTATIPWIECDTRLLKKKNTVRVA